MRYLIAALLFSTAALANDCAQPDRMVVIPEAASNLATLSWTGDVSGPSDDVWTVKHAVGADTIFIDAFESMRFAKPNPDTENGWGVHYELDHSDAYLGDLTCGLWEHPHLVVVNCNVPNR